MTGPRLSRPCIERFRSTTRLRDVSTQKSRTRTETRSAGGWESGAQTYTVQSASSMNHSPGESSAPST